MSSGLLAQVVAQLNSATTQLDEIAIRAVRAQADVEQAYQRFTAAGHGSKHPDIRAAVTQSRTAMDKAGRLGKLNSDAARHLAAYVNEIAPGSAPLRDAAEPALPSGERVVTESESRGSKAEAFLRRHVKKAEETEGNLQSAEKAVTDGFRELMQQIKNRPGGATTSTSQPTPVAPAERPQLEHPVTSVIMAAGAVVIGLKGLSNMIKKRRERKHRDDQS
ncbi:hypothetical protein [Micromonospora sp. NPDC048830]|uniref:hypothetical protein n=1 Tax=Micromonospora sp. NPDC048830 TaxID=3364257 RepID=UPI0037191EC7